MELNILIYNGDFKKFHVKHVHDLEGLFDWD